MKSLFLYSPAKINLTLQVLKKREDNYHEIYTIFQKIDLWDEVEIKKNKRSFSLEVFSNPPIPIKKNLAYKAYQKFKENFKIKDKFIIKIKKNIPIGAGLGGGSSNAASILKGLAYFYEIDLNLLYPLAKNLGADVLFFLNPYSSAIGEGIGDILKPFPSFPAWYIIIYPDFQISTKWAYKNLKLTNSKNPVYYRTDTAPWNQAQGLINDFKGLVFEKYKILKYYENLLKNFGAKAVGLTGTGSSLFGIFEQPPFLIYSSLNSFIKKGKTFLVKNLN